MSKHDIRTANAFSFIVEQYGGVENIGFSKRDAYNFINRERLHRVELGDSMSLLKLFKERKDIDPLFDWKILLDEGQRLTNIMWADGYCKLDYDAFDDVVIFDANYRMNKYNLVCAPLIGVNNHRHNVLFASSFEFEEMWSQLLEKGQLHKHKWLWSLYKCKHKWCTVLNEDIVGLGILSTPRSESTNNICHDISKPTSMLTDCFLGLERMVMRWRQIESEDDFKYNQSLVTPSVLHSPLLKQARNVYTIKIYNIFEKVLLNGAAGHFAIEISTANNAKLFSVGDFNTKKKYYVTFNIATLEVVCSCRRFETVGLLCSMR
ncbi:Protein FAR1-like sequence 5 [Apostasia shenzhenica]|uniref:Protein FAR1-like sequence 5 n=1 Tax=Apostasia shenzhenica TaxID=1088818 RepID=A0A2I0B882_9ASPA|nr:Protein FAR1-like sequence 5 [Apostasia shenzhenica]